MEDNSDIQQKQESVPPLYDEVQLGATILKVEAKLSDELPDKVEVEWLDKEGKKQLGLMRVPHFYKELLTTDVSTANIDNIDRAICASSADLCSHIKAFSKKKNLDLTSIHNRIANHHNYLMVASKASGFGAQAAKSHFITQKVDRKSLMTEQTDGKGGLMNWLSGGKV